jgi:hypothetical protein
MGKDATEYAVIVKISVKAKDEDEAEQKAWEFLCTCNRGDIDFYVERQR